MDAFFPNQGKHRARITDELIRERAAGCRSRGEFKAKHNSSYHVALKRNMIEGLFPEKMKPPQKPKVLVWCDECLDATARRGDGACALCHIKAYRSKYYAENKEKLTLDNKAYREKNRESLIAKAKAYRDATRSAATERTRVWRRLNRERTRELNNSRASRAREATPAWADKDAIRAIYRQCGEFRAAGIDCEVDHIFPLKGKTVSGLHCEFNLRIITAYENNRKGNQIEQEP